MSCCGGPAPSLQEFDAISRLVSAKLAAFLRTLRDNGFAVGLAEGQDAATLMTAGYAERPGWRGWDDVEALAPVAELQDFIMELRSQTMGLGSYRHSFDHLAEARGRTADTGSPEAARNRKKSA